MDRLLTAAMMRDAERAAIDAGRVTGAELMERAGRGAVAAIMAAWPDLAPRRAVVLCGPGNNGGDGFVVARHLHARGWDVDLRLMGDAARLPPDAALNHARWAALGPVRAFRDEETEGIRGDGAPALVVDALFGTGLSRPLEAPVTARTLSAMVSGPPRTRVAALDMPSGWCADSGRFLAAAQDAPRTAAHLTLTFHAAKLGQFLGDGPGACGRLERIDIGLEQSGGGVPRLGPSDCRDVRKAGGHKYDHGHALVLCGGPGRGGAARLAARGALRIGAGLVTLAVPPAALQENATRLDAIMLRPVRDADALAGLLEDGRINAVMLGPGLGTGERTRALVAAALAARRATVLDADALTSFADDPGALFAQLHEGCVLTPHDGEFARLFPDIHAPLQRAPQEGPATSRLDAARAAAGCAGATVLLKGPATIVAAPDGTAAISAAVYDAAAPGLATAGAGDTLAGIIAGLLARGVGPLSAAAQAAWLHAECARQFGPGLIAEDLPEMLPQVLRAL